MTPIGSALAMWSFADQSLQWGGFNTVIIPTWGLIATLRWDQSDLCLSLKVGYILLPEKSIKKKKILPLLPSVKVVNTISWRHLLCWWGGLELGCSMCYSNSEWFLNISSLFNLPSASYILCASTCLTRGIWAHHTQWSWSHGLLASGGEECVS